MYPDTCRALAFHAIVDAAIQKIQTALLGIGPAISNPAANATISTFSRSYARICDQALLPSYAAAIQSTIDGWPPETLLPKYRELFMGAGEFRPVQERVLEESAPLLERLEQCLQGRSEFVAQAISDYSRDRARLQEVLGCALNLTRISPTEGDSHNGGEAVLLFEFSDSLRLYYKPSNLGAMGTPLEVLLRQVASVTRTPSILPRAIQIGNHQWSCEVRFESLASSRDVDRYWNCAGTILAICDMFNFTDGHFANVVATSGGPTIIDSETFFQNFRTRFGEGEEHSILFTGLVQSREDIVHDRPLMAAYQIYGGNRTESVYPHPVNERTIRLSVSMKGRREEPPLNCPILDNEFVTIDRNISPVMSGMSCAYRDISQMWRNGDLDLEGVSQIQVRQLLRPTIYYLLLMRLIEQPPYSGNANLAERLLRDKLTLEEIGDVEIDPNRVVDYEVQAILRMDVPMFYSVPGSRHLIDGSGAVYEDFFAASAIEQVAARLDSLDAEYVERQQHIMAHHASLVRGDIKLSELDKRALAEYFSGRES